MRENTKMQWQERVIDLWNTKDSSLLGGVGEAIAWKYLWAKGMIVWPFWRVVYELEHLFIDKLTKGQADFFEGYRSMAAATNMRAFDLAGIHRRTGQAYLVEVKSTRSERYRYDDRKFPGVEQRLQAKSLGFKLLLVVVRYMDSWRFRITCKEL
jgi:hypothetical protein